MSGGVGQLKKCPQCGIVRSCSQFHKSAARTDGYNRICKRCARAKYLSWSESAVQGRRVTARAHGGRKRCCNCLRLRDVSCFHKHILSPDGLRGRCKECVSEYVKEVYKGSDEYKAMAKQRKHARRARLRDAYVEFVDPRVLFERDEGICGICNKPVSRLDYHVDHIIPIFHGGEHSYRNCQVAHPACNHSKGARLVGTVVYA